MDVPRLTRRIMQVGVYPAFRVITADSAQVPVDFTGVQCIISVLFQFTGNNTPQGDSMAYIICEPCVGTKDTACVDACPVDCIHPKKDEAEFEAATMLYIHPEECIDCGACEPACPVTAIFPEDNVPEQWQNYIAMNYEHYGLTKK